MPGATRVVALRRRCLAKKAVVPDQGVLPCAAVKTIRAPLKLNIITDELFDLHTLGIGGLEAGLEANPVIPDEAIIATPVIGKSKKIWCWPRTPSASWRPVSW